MGQWTSCTTLQMIRSLPASAAWPGCMHAGEQSCMPSSTSTRPCKQSCMLMWISTSDGPFRPAPRRENVLSADLLACGQSCVLQDSFPPLPIMTFGGLLVVLALCITSPAWTAAEQLQPTLQGGRPPSACLPSLPASHAPGVSCEHCCCWSMRHDSSRADLWAAALLARRSLLMPCSCPLPCAVPAQLAAA